jgi:hypothetical protein
MIDEPTKLTQPPSDRDTEGNQHMSSSPENMDKVQNRVRELEVAQATQAATLAGAQATQAAAHAGTWRHDARRRGRLGRGNVPWNGDRSGGA